ncbi:MAG TPA: glycosyltransferase family 4 protein [Opitutaceae bacterium]|nr:glycosyltransferase family 4 protein [Opitutaceae bacterium]
MKSLLLCPELFAADGGIARILRLYLKALADLDEPRGDTRLIVLNDSTITADQLNRYALPSKVVSCGRNKLKFLLATLRHAAGIDRIVCGHLHLLPIALLAKTINPKLDYYLVAHGIEVWRPYSLVEKMALQRAKKILCVSEYTRKEMLSNLSLDPRKLVVVPNALDPYFSISAPIEDARNDASPIILCVSRLNQRDNYKGVDHLIEALPLIHTEMPDARLRIVGDGNDAPRLKTLASTMHVAKSVEFMGNIDDASLRRQYADCTIFALPSQMEGFGLVYLEAMANGKPCIGARTGGVPEVIDENSGVLVEYGKIDELSKACINLLKGPKASEIVRTRAKAFSYDHLRTNVAHALKTLNAVCYSH